MKTYFVVNLRHKSLKVLDYSLDDLKADLKLFGLSDPLELNSILFDARVFGAEKQALDFIASYKDALKGLKTLKNRPKESIPCLLLKRRFLVLASLKQKTFTLRSSAKNWKVGQKFYFHDQTFFINAIVKNCSKVGKKFRIDYTLAND